MVDVDFIEIGTSYFGTLIQKATDDDIGFSVEPLKHYLDQLPDRKNVTKVNYAIVRDGDVDYMDVYHILPDVLWDTHNNPDSYPEHQRKLPDYLLGCNRMGEYHPLHLKYMRGKPRDLRPLVQIDKVKVSSVSNFMQEFQIGKIKYLKTDTEGMDAPIVQGFLDWAEPKGPEFFPQKVQFESYPLKKSRREAEELIERMHKLNYETTLVKMPNITLEYRGGI